MARVKITAKEVVEASGSMEERAHLSESEEDLANVDADVSELMGTDAKVWTFICVRGAYCVVCGQGVL